MFFKKRNLLLTIILIIIIQILIYTNNNKKTSFRYFIWNLQEVHVGKLISISFFSGLFLSFILNNTKNSSLKNKKNISNKKEENLEPEIENEVNESISEMPPQRDVRDAQPTISVNYRVIKNNDEKNQKFEPEISNDFDNKDDWINDDKDW